MSSLVFQIKSFAVTLILGIVAGFFFHFYQGVIARAKVEGFLLYVLDFFLWIIMIGVFFYVLFFINGGEIRVYILLALLAGIVIYLSCFFQRLKGAIDYGTDMLAHIIARLVRIIKKTCEVLKNWITVKKKPPIDEK